LTHAARRGTTRHDVFGQSLAAHPEFTDMPVFGPDQYALLDFGAGRKLERFGSQVIDRPSPVAEEVLPADSSGHAEAAARFVRAAGGVADAGAWAPPDRLPDHWSVRHGELVFELRPTSSGQIGLFPEQAGNWDWIGEQVRCAGRPLRVLNLFGYTGGSTLAAAAAGAAVAHVDAGRGVVRWARRNAELSRLAQAQIRWIVEDARRFAERERRRGRSYDAFVLDPPSYGHGPRGEAWKIDVDLHPLVEACAGLTSDHPAFIVLTSHSPHFGPDALRMLVENVFFRDRRSRDFAVQAEDLFLRSVDGRRLAAGHVARWPGA
jgi:23S rRNA (cytosine1962-C5)-methyltransferase